MGNKLTRKIASVVVSAATVVSLSGLMPLAAHAQVSDLQAQINALLAQIASLQAQLAAQGGAPAAGGADACFAFSRNLTVGSRGDDVTALQGFLAAQGHLSVSPTGYFGPLTKTALSKFQSVKSIAPSVGYFGPISRAKVGSMCVPASAPAPAPAPAPGAGPAPVSVGSGLTVRLSAQQPAATIAPASASRIPFTNFDLVNATAADVSVSSIIVERTGLAEDAAFSGVLLLDDKDAQLGLAKTLSSDHRATIGEAFVVKAGESKKMVVAGNRAAAASRGGQTASFSVVGVNVAAGVVLNAVFPLVGATHTINETLTIGSVVMARAADDPGASQSKEVGTKDYIFSSLRVTAGSAEDIYLKSIRWNQTGSAGATDLGDIKTYVDGVGYDTTLSSDGKYYTSVFPGAGILIEKGFSKNAGIKGNIIGGSARTIDFDVAKRTDLYVVGKLYGYGIIPPATGASVPTADTAAFSSSEDPWYDAAQVTVNPGTMTASADPDVAAQNIALNLADQSLGGWTVDVKGESITVGSLVFNWSLTNNAGAAPAGTDLDNVKLVDGTGKVLAGPIDFAGSGTSGTATFTDTITFPVGITKLKMLGKLATNFANNDTVRASSTPSSDWTTVTGVKTGVTITPSPTSAVSGNIMTVKGPAVTISVATVPISQTVIAGKTQFEFARYILDTSSSGEDLRLVSFPLEYNLGGGSATDLTNCQIVDGSVSITTGSNVVNPSAAGSSTSFTLDGLGLTLVKGASKQLSLKCDIRAGSTGRYTWGYDGSSSPSPTGLVSGQSATVTENDSAGQTMIAAAAGTLSVALDSSSPAYAVASPGQVVELARFKFSATNEDVDIKQVALQLSGVASNTAVDLVDQKVELYDGAVKVGEAVFSSIDFATSSAITGFRVAKDGSKVLIVKGTISGITTSGPLVRSGDLLIVDYDGNNTGLTGNYGTGVSSGATIAPTGADSASNGARINRAYPTLSKVDLSSSERLLTAGDDKSLYKFKVTANNGDVAVYKWTFSVASSTTKGGGAYATTSKFSLFVFTNDSFSTPDSNYNSSANPAGLINSGNCSDGQSPNTSNGRYGGSLGSGSVGVEVFVDRTGCNSATTSLIIPSGSSRWFRLAGSVGTLAPSGTSESIQVQLEGDSAFPTRHIAGATSSGDMGRSGSPDTGTGTADTGVDTDTHDDFIWSPISTTTTNTIFDLDWTNGYGIVGLPGSNMSPETLSK